MSYQFEDDSALEELLNQQLDRRRQQTLSGRPATSSNSRSVQAFRPTTSSRPNNELQVHTDRGSSHPTTLSDQSAAPRGKLASWLAATDNPPAPSTLASAKQSSPDGQVSSRGNDGAAQAQQTPAAARIPSVSARKETTASVTNPISSRGALELFGDEDKLQAMSKQRLIQWILEEIRPNMRALMEAGELKLRQEVERLNNELLQERDRHRLREEQQLGLMESKWENLNRQLELRLERSEAELKAAKEDQKSLIKELDDEFRRQMKQMDENYQIRLEEEKRNSEETLRRSQELHRLELNSKLKVNLELDKLETTFSEWQRMVRLTVGEFGDQLKSIENLLEKQTSAINTNNVDLSKKSKQLSEQYARFESLTGQLQELSSKLNHEILPQFALNQTEKQSTIDEINLRLEQLDKRAEYFERSKLEADELKRELETNKDELGKEKFHIALESSRLSFKEEKLNELIERNEKHESELMELKSNLRQKEAKIEASECNLDSKSKKLREQNYELHLIRKRLASKEEDLAKVESKLNEKSCRLEKDETKFKEDKKQLEDISNRIKRESSQLKRLQKSMICSLCFERLFEVEQPGKKSQQIFHTSREFHLDDTTDRPQCATIASHKSFLVPQEDHFMNLSDLSILAGLDDYLEADAEQLESECKYVDLLPKS